jgi:hypothetical protein
MTKLQRTRERSGMDSNRAGTQTGYAALSSVSANQSVIMVEV